MNEASSTREISMGSGEGNREDQGGHRLILPEDGYQWRKYGQKFIKNIGKIRSYFKCNKENCNAKKRVEWSELEPDNIRVVYDGVHTHALSSPGSASSGGTSDANRYNLLNQVFGNRSTS